MVQNKTIFSDLNESFANFQSTISDIQKEFGRLTHKIEKYRETENVPKSYLKEMAANLAHEIRNPLGGISTLVELLSFDKTGNQSKNVAGILQGVERIDKIVENLILFSNPLNLKPVTCNFSEIVTQAVGSFRNDHGKHNDLHLEQQLPEQSIFLKVDPTLMHKAFYNVLSNAVENKAKTVNILLTINRDKDKVTLCLSDDGTGLKETNEEKPFYPFYTTKTYGMGMGLPTARLIVEEHGGRIHLRQNIDHGVIVLVHLPFTLN